MEMMRLTTLHPAFVHFAIGMVPVMLFAYVLARARKSDTWTFVGDVALFGTALFSIVAAASGVISFLLVRWPGGLGFWKWLHLGLGVCGAVAIVSLAVHRYRGRPRQHSSGGGTLIIAAVGSILLLMTGWVGGEVLVFHSGVAVQAAGGGAFAPPAASPVGGGPPKDLEDAMGRIRGHWSVANTRLATMIVWSPRNQDYDAIVREMEALRVEASWLARMYADRALRLPPHDDEDSSDIFFPGGQVAAAIPGGVFVAADGSDAAVAGKDSKRGGTAEADAAAGMTMSNMLVDRADDVAKHARARNIVRLSRAVGAMSGLCASCHDQFR